MTSDVLLQSIAACTAARNRENETMKAQWILRIHRGVGAALVAMLFAAVVAAADRLTVPQGTVIGLRMDSGLSSATAREGDTFRATVVRSVSINSRIAIPRDSRVDGRVTLVKRAEPGVRSGVIGVEFFRLMLPDNTAYDIDGALTSLRPDEGRQPIEQAQFSSARNNSFVGGGLNAIIAALSPGGPDGSSFLSSGTEAQVSAGSEVATQLLRAVTLNASEDSQGGGLDRVVYTSSNMIRGAQAALRERNYYRGQIDGRMGEQTRQALRDFQNDNGRPSTGDLDQATASLLGLVRVGDSSSTDPQVSGAIYRKAQSLLSNYESALGVRVGDIRSGLTSSRVLTESDLDLLLQLDSFTNAANWYEQAIRNAPNAEAATVAARILMRSATRVEDDLPNARESQQFRNEWASIQSDLNQIGFNNSGQVSSSGHFQWQGIVDGTDNILLRGSSVQSLHLQSGPLQNSTYQLPGSPLPSRPVTVTLRNQRGRGEIRLLEQPSAANAYTAVVQVNDQGYQGNAWYEFTLDW
jgi:peptidoglycan hydrolase-like protein with peptidoglycan-binding domain